MGIYYRLVPQIALDFPQCVRWQRSGEWNCYRQCMLATKIHKIAHRIAHDHLLMKHTTISMRLIHVSTPSWQQEQRLQSYLHRESSHFSEYLKLRHTKYSLILNSRHSCLIK